MVDGRQDPTSEEKSIYLKADDQWPNPACFIFGTPGAEIHTPGSNE